MNRGPVDDFTADVIAVLTARKLTVAVAESLTGGLLVAELIRPPGASAVVLGGVVAYDSEIKNTVLGVDSAILARHGAVHPEVARQLAEGVRTRLAVRGRNADIGIATTGVAGPDSQDGIAPGTVYVAISMGSESRVRELQLSGERLEIRENTVSAAMNWLAETLERGLGSERE